MGRKTLLVPLFLLAVAGLMLHARIHYFMVPVEPDSQVLRFSPTFFLSFAFPLLDVVVVTVLFLSRATALYGYMLNGLIVIYGTVFMSHFSIAQLGTQSAPALAWVTKSTLPDIAIAWGDFFVGKALYDLYQREEKDFSVD